MKYQNTDTWRDARPAFLCDVAAIETWLEDRAAQGYRLVDFKGTNGIFVRDEPKPCRYRLGPLPKKETAPAPELAAAYQEMGWTYAATIGRAFHVWRCDDPAAPELDTDPVVQAEGYGYLKRRLLRELLWAPLAVLLLIALEVWLRLGDEFPLWSVLHDQAPGLLPFRAAAIAAALAAALWEYRGIRRLLHRLKTGVPLDRPAPYRWQKCLSKIMTVLIVCLYCSNLASGLLGGFWPMSDPKEALRVDLAALDPGAAVERTSADMKIHELAPRMYRTSQSSAGFARSLHTEYYHLCAAALAPALERDLLRWRTHYGDSAMEQLEGTPLDSFWWREVDGGQEVVAVLGRNILLLQYEGPADLRASAAYLAEALEN